MNARSRCSAGRFFWRAAATPRRHAPSCRVCNQTSYMLYAAVGYEAGAQMLTRGWTRVLPGDCAWPCSDHSNQPQYFLYARSSRAHSGPALAWGGHIRLCAKETNFAIDVPVGADALRLRRCVSSCRSPPCRQATRRRWTATLAGSRRYAGSPPPRAQRGSRGCSRDIGYKIDAGGIGEREHPRARKFPRPHAAGRQCKRHGSVRRASKPKPSRPPRRPAIRSATTGSRRFWAAIALRSKRNSVVRGWWDVPSGACAKALTTPLDYDNVYLLAQKHGNDKLVSGNRRLSAWPTSRSRFTATRRAPRRILHVGFASTNTKGVTGLVVHVGNDGLLPPAPKWTPARPRNRPF